MKSSLFISLLLFFVIQSLIAQPNQFGLSINPGISNMEFVGSSVPKNRLAFSGNAGVYYNRNLTSNTALVTELLFVWIQGKHADATGEYFRQMGFQSVLPSKNLVETTINSTYMAIPVFFKFSKKNMALRLGFQSMFSINTFYNGNRTQVFGDETVKTSWKHQGKADTKFNGGPKIGVEYSIGPNLALRTEYYHGIKKSDSYLFKAEISQRQLTLGLQYSLHPINNNSEQ